MDCRVLLCRLDDQSCVRSSIIDLRQHEIQLSTAVASNRRKAFDMGYDQGRTKRTQPAPFNEAVQQCQILSTATFTGPTDGHDLVFRGFFSCIVQRFSVSKHPLGLV